MSIGNRGKWAEGKFHDYAEMRSSMEEKFSVHRFPDARAGSFQPAPADFMCMLNGVFHLVEVKEVNHERLLPHKNFSPDKIARCRKWLWAGAHVVVLVNFEPLGPRGRGWQEAVAWRVAPLMDFLPPWKGGSWDMSGTPLMTFGQAMDTIFNL